MVYFIFITHKRFIYIASFKRGRLNCILAKPMTKKLYITKIEVSMIEDMQLAKVKQYFNIPSHLKYIKF